MLLFIGEQRSPAAIKKGWSWGSSHLASATLLAALRELDLSYGQHYTCLNLWTDIGTLDAATVRILSSAVGLSIPILALGKKVARQLEQMHFPFTYMIHPAARGTIQQRARYQTHVLVTLAPFLSSDKFPDASSQVLMPQQYLHMPCTA